MEKGVSEVQGMLERLKENIAELLPSFEDTVAEQVEAMVNNEKRELRKKFKSEQEDLINEYKKEKTETEDLFMDCGIYARKCLYEVNSEKEENMKAVTREEELKNSEELEKIITETRNNTIAELSSGGESIPMEISENPDFASKSTPKCATCGEESVWLNFCDACIVTRYCDEICQRMDWANHENTCVGLRHN